MPHSLFSVEHTPAYRTKKAAKDTAHRTAPRLCPPAPTGTSQLAPRNSPPPMNHRAGAPTSCREAAEVVPLTVQDLSEKLAAAAAAGESDTQFVDVREEGELRLAALPQFQLFPLSRCVLSCASSDGGWS